VRHEPAEGNSAVSATDGRVRTLVVDDQRPFRLAIAGMLRRCEEFALVGEADSGEKACELAEALAPDLVLMDLRMPGIDGLEAARRICREAPRTVVLLCTTYALADLPPAEGQAVRAYVAKENLAPELLRQLWAEHGTHSPTW
jgi:CheY-like chemotaxis protein